MSSLSVWMGCVIVVACSLAGCGTGTPAGGGVVTPGPSVGGNAPGANDQGNSGGTAPANDNEATDDTDTDNRNSSSAADDDPGADSDEPTVDACVSISGRTFLAPGAAATLSFVAGSFTWTIGGAQAVGTFECSGLAVTGVTMEGEVFSGRYEPQLDQVIWEGLVYRPVGP